METAQHTRKLAREPQHLVKKLPKKQNDEEPLGNEENMMNMGEYFTAKTQAGAYPTELTKLRLTRYTTGLPD